MQRRTNMFKDIISSITKFEEYEEFAAHKLKRTILYILKLTIISSLILSIVFSIKSFCIIQDIFNEFKERIYSIEFENNKLSINNDSLVKINYPQFINIIIETSEDSEKIKKKELIDKLDTEINSIIILKDKCIINNTILADFKEYTYQDMQKNGIEINEIFYNIMTIKELKSYLIVLFIFIIFLISLSIIYGINLIIDVTFFACISKFTSWILRVPLNFKKNYNISAHALTLSILLQTIYISVNTAIGFNLKYFSIMYIGIAYIYIITAILMIKSEMIQRKVEVNKIIEEQKK